MIYVGFGVFIQARAKLMLQPSNQRTMTSKNNIVVDMSDLDTDRSSLLSSRSIRSTSNRG